MAAFGLKAEVPWGVIRSQVLNKFVLTSIDLSVLYLPMSRKCVICSKGTVLGNSISRRGKAKREGGVGKKTTGIARREFQPNLQRRKILVDGKVKHVLVCAKCLKAGKIAVAKI